MDLAIHLERSGEEINKFRTSPVSVMMPQIKGQIFLDQSGHLLSHYGYKSDPGEVLIDDKTTTFFHYTHPKHLDNILSHDGGLRARLPVVSPPEHLKGRYVVSGLLEPWPQWLSLCPYFGNLGQELMNAYVGKILLKISVPLDFEDLFVSDYAHALECKHRLKRGTSPLGLGYDCSSGVQVTQACSNSFIPAKDYKGGHIAPIFEATRIGQGIVIPSKFISLAEIKKVNS